MNSKPYIFRLIFTVIVVAVFAVSMIPLNQQDLFETLEGFIVDEQVEKIQEVIKLSKEKQSKDINLYASVALEEAASELEVDLLASIEPRYRTGLSNNRDVISKIRKSASSSIRLGIDLNGGVEYLFSLSPNKDADEKKKLEIANDFDGFRDKTIEVLRRRLEKMNINEAELTPIGEKFVSLKAPIVSKDEKLLLLNMIKRTAKLQFRLLHESLGGTGEPPVGFERMPITSVDKKGKKTVNYEFVDKRSRMSGKNISNAFPRLDQYGRREIILNFNTAGAKTFGEVTTKYKGRRLGIVLDGTLYSAPNIQSAITGGTAQITGSFSNDEATNISNILVSGSLPLTIDKDISVFDTDPTLGKAHVTSGLMAGIIALGIVVLFMFVYYRKAGLIANIALVANIVLVLGSLSAFEATLTLPGIAGIILTIGMAVDANVLIFERIREEMDKGIPLHTAIDLGYSKAFSTILDANLTTLFTAMILIWQGTGAIKGFAITLAIGIATSMFTALFLTRLLFDMIGRIPAFSEKMKMMQLFKRPNINFLKLKPVTIIVSGSLILLTVVMFSIKGKEAFGIDFRGGIQMTFDYEERVQESDIKLLLEKEGNFKDPKVVYKQNATEKKLEIIIPNSNISEVGNVSSQAVTPKDVVSSLLAEKYPKSKFSGGSERTLGGLIGEEFTKSAIYAIIMAMIGIVIYISLRFEFTFAMASLIALIHDVLIATGIFLLSGRELSLPVIAALLTIIGYSLNDTIVVFDRIREDIGLINDKSYKAIINISINETLSRTVLTSLTTLLVLTVLFFAGGIAIGDFVFVMITGIIIGTYSSIFVASPIVSVWHKHIGANIKIQDEEITDEAIEAELIEG